MKESRIGWIMLETLCYVPIAQSKVKFSRFIFTSFYSFTINRFVGPYTPKDFPVMKKLRERIYFEASVDTQDHRLTILARDCYATPSPNRNSAPKYWIIKNG